MRHCPHPSMRIARLIFLTLFLPSCGGGEAPTGATPAPTPDPTPTPGLSTEVVVGDRTGPTEITFIAAEPPPGTSLSGCGANASGCSGQIRMRFRLLSASGGYVQELIGGCQAAGGFTSGVGAAGELVGKVVVRVLPAPNHPSVGPVLKSEEAVDVGGTLDDCHVPTDVIVTASPTHQKPGA